MAALSYAARGWHVFPLRPGDKRPAFPDHPADRCARTDPRCRAAGRHVTWEARATTDPDRIARAWSSLPFGIGIACGPSGLVVVDLDRPKPGDTPPPAWQLPGVTDGADVFAYLAATHGGTDFPDTPTALTPSGGRHVYYAHPTGPAWDGARLGNTAGALGWLVDTRAHGGYVVAPPTTLPTGTYQLHPAATLAPLPDWIAAALRPTRTNQIKARRTPLMASQGASRASAYLRAALDAEAAHVRAAPAGERNRALFVAAANLGELVAGGELDQAAARAVLTEAAAVHLGVHDFTATEAQTAITSGLRRGATRPRRITPAAA